MRIECSWGSAPPALTHHFNKGLNRSSKSILLCVPKSGSASLIPDRCLHPSPEGIGCICRSHVTQGIITAVTLNFQLEWMEEISKLVTDREEKSQARAWNIRVLAVPKQVKPLRKVFRNKGHWYDTESRRALASRSVMEASAASTWTRHVISSKLDPRLIVAWFIVKLLVSTYSKVWWGLWQHLHLWEELQSANSNTTIGFQKRHHTIL